MDEIQMGIYVCRTSIRNGGGQKRRFMTHRLVDHQDPKAFTCGFQRDLGQERQSSPKEDKAEPHFSKTLTKAR